MSKIIRAYLSHEFGFSEIGRYILENLFKPRIRENAIERWFEIIKKWYESMRAK